MTDVKEAVDDLKKVISIVTKDDVIKHLSQLRATLAHSLTQPNISAKRFNDIREQLMPLDEQLRNLGVDLAPTPQMAATYVRPTRHQRRKQQRAAKYGSYESRMRQKLADKRATVDEVPE